VRAPKPKEIIKRKLRRKRDFFSFIACTFMHGKAFTVAITMSIPSKIIVAWYGLLADIPAGWHICDGTSGTPDLRGYFIRGALAGVESSDTIQGSDTHDHTGITEFQAGTTMQSGTGTTRTIGHQHAFTTDPANNLPYHKRLVFIMKT
jgi:hypothetical protein